MPSTLTFGMGRVCNMLQYLEQFAPYPDLLLSLLIGVIAASTLTTVAFFCLLRLLIPPKDYISEAFVLWEEGFRANYKSTTPTAVRLGEQLDVSAEVWRLLDVMERTSK